MATDQSKGKLNQNLLSLKIDLVSYPARVEWLDQYVYTNNYSTLTHTHSHTYIYIYIYIYIVYVWALLKSYN